MTVHIEAPGEGRRPLPAILNGLSCRCPQCGQGKLFRAYLKVVDRCTSCREELFHHRADDMPPYISIVIVGHILVGALLHMEMTMVVQPWVYLATLLPLAVILPLATLPSIKGAVVGLQWANRMHGFDTSQRDPALLDEAGP